MRWVFILSSIVVLVALFSAIGLHVLTPSPTLFQYRLTIALLCFALSTVAGLLFAAKVQLSGTIGVLSVTLGGTAVLWLGALVVFNYVFPEHSLTQTREYDLRLSLIFPESDPANPFSATVNSFVRKLGEPAERPYQPATVERGAGGIVVHFDELQTGDKLYVVVEDGSRRWRSNDMVTPRASLQMNQMPTVPR